ncbi:hypothetical protein EDD16DRAFT_1583003 [Pisolithus croceorrhizus]|nr:hypothetical protein EDD16DRAFT_1583003 [Pisolithus croceorrhizus]
MILVRASRVRWEMLERRVTAILATLTSAKSLRATTGCNQKYPPGRSSQMVKKTPCPNREFGGEDAEGGYLLDTFRLTMKPYLKTVGTSKNCCQG